MCACVAVWRVFPLIVFVCDCVRPSPVVQTVTSHTNLSYIHTNLVCSLNGIDALPNMDTVLADVDSMQTGAAAITTALTYLKANLTVTATANATLPTDVTDTNVSAPPLPAV